MFDTNHHSLNFLFVMLFYLITFVMLAELSVDTIIYPQLDKIVGFWLVNDPCVQNPCSRLVVTKHHGGSLCCYACQTHNIKTLWTHTKGGRNSWNKNMKKVLINTQKKKKKIMQQIVDSCYMKHWFWCYFKSVSSYKLSRCLNTTILKLFHIIVITWIRHSLYRTISVWHICIYQ